MNAGSSNEALAELLASSDDIVQVMRDDANLVPLYHVMAAAAVPSTTDAQGNVQHGVLDATTALLARGLGARLRLEQGPRSAPTSSTPTLCSTSRWPTWSRR